MTPLTLAQMAGGEGPPPFLLPLLFVAMFGIWYVLVLRPQQTREREKDDFRSKLKKGDDVVAAGGIYGRVADVKGSVVWLEPGPNGRIRVERRSVEPLPARPQKAEEKETTAS